MSRDGGKKEKRECEEKEEEEWVCENAGEGEERRTLWILLR